MCTTKIKIAIVVVVIVIVIWWWSRYSMWYIRDVISPFDSTPYKVHTQHTDMVRAADMMGRLNNRVIDLLSVLKNRIPTATPRQRTIINRILKRYNPDALAENSPLN